MNAFWRRYSRSIPGLIGVGLLTIYILAGLLAPFLAASKPLVMLVNGEWYFPLFRYLFYSGYYTKAVDIFFNILIFTLPLALITRKWITFAVFQIACFLSLWLYPFSDPASDRTLSAEKQSQVNQKTASSWGLDLAYMNDYAKLNILIDSLRFKAHDARLRTYVPESQKIYSPFILQKESLEKDPDYLLARNEWIENQKVDVVIWPLFREFHWEDDAGGDQALNQQVPWWEITRITRKDMVAGLIFGIRISLMVGVLSIAIAFAIGVPIGALAGFYGGKVDIVTSRLLEIWEAMPTFFMLLLIVSMTGSKSIFLVILIIGLFGWSGFSRYIRGEFFKERALPYVEACKVFGFSPAYTMFNHILPNAIPPVLTLLPFAILGAISAEAGLSFLGLGEEGSASWGVLMDEGRKAFPSESYLLWPPAILLTLLLIAIGLIGDALRDALDPKS